MCGKWDISYLHLIPVRKRILHDLPLRPPPMLQPLLLLPLRIQRYIPRLLLNHSHNLLLRTRMKHIPALSKQQLHMLCNIPAGDIYSPYTTRHRETFVNGDGVRDPVASIEHYACCAAGGVKGQYGLDGGVESGDVEGFEQNLGGCVTVCSGVEGGFC